MSSFSCACSSVLRRAPTCSGVYSISTTYSGRVYIGSAVNFKLRWRLHRNMLRKGKHHCKPLQNAWLKYGESAFIFNVLEETTRENLIAREQYYLDSVLDKFNICPITLSTLGRSVSQETREKRSRPILKIEADTEKVLECFISLSEAKRQTGINNISASLSGLQRTSGGFLWRYKMETQQDLLRRKVERESKEDLQSVWRRGRMNAWEKNKVKIQQVDQKTLKVVKEFSSIVEAAIAIDPENRENVRRAIQSAVSGRQKSARGFLWRRV